MDQDRNDASRASVESFFPRPIQWIFPSSWIAALVWLLRDEQDHAWHGDKLIKSIRDNQGKKDK